MSLLWLTLVFVQYKVIWFCFDLVIVNFAMLTTMCIYVWQMLLSLASFRKLNRISFLSQGIISQSFCSVWEIQMYKLITIINEYNQLSYFLIDIILLVCLLILYKLLYFVCIFNYANMYISDSPFTEMCAFSLNDLLHLIQSLCDLICSFPKASYS
jgi:hypothetical protein